MLSHINLPAVYTGIVHVASSHSYNLRHVCAELQAVLTTLRQRYINQQCVRRSNIPISAVSNVERVFSYKDKLENITFPY